MSVDNHMEISNHSYSSSKKTVSFCKKVRVKPSLHVRNYSPAERDNTWYTAAESKSMRQDIKNTVDLYQKGLMEVCPRGLEGRTSQGATQKKWRRLDALSVVLDEQEHQRMDNGDDPEYMATLLREVTEASVAQAIAVGLSDHQEAVAAAAAMEDSPAVPVVNETPRQKPLARPPKRFPLQKLAAPSSPTAKATTSLAAPPMSLIALLASPRAA